MAMNWWYGLVGLQRPRSYPYSWIRQYAELPEFAQQIEAAGFHNMLFTEHHFWYDGYLPSLLVAMAGVAKKTKKLRLGTGALLLPLHDPLRVAEEVALVDNLCDGRLDLGIGVGYRPEEFLGFSTDKRTRGVRCREAMEFLRQVLSGESCTFEGKYYQYNNINISPKPIQKPPPIWYAAGGADTTAYEGGKSGLNYWAGPATGPERVRELLDIYTRGVVDGGLDPGSLGKSVCRDVVVAETKKEAWDIVERQVMPMYSEQLIGYGFLLDEDGKPLLSLEPGDPAYESMLEGIIWGTAAEVTRQLQEYSDMGFTTLNPRLYGAAWDMQTQYRSLKIFSEQVMPYFN